MSGDKFRISQCDVEKKKCNPSSENSTTEQCYCWLNGGDHLDLPEWGVGRVGGLQCTDASIVGGASL